MKTISFMASMAILFAIACNSGSTERADIATTIQMEPATVADSTNAATDNIADIPTQDEPAKPKNISGKPTYTDWDKKLIKTANITIEANNYTRFDQDIRQNLKRYGAYIASEEQTFSEERKQNQMTIKVPVAEFESLLNSFASDSVRIIQKNVGTEDVTAEMYDSRSRIEARKKIRDRYVQLLQDAKKMDDILKVEQEINNIQEQLESVNGRLNYLSHQSAYSTIHLNYYSFITATSITPKPNPFWTRLKDGFAEGGDILVEIILIGIRIWPLILSGLLIGFLWKRRKIQVLKK